MYDQRRLFYTDSIMSIDVSLIDGKAYAKFLLGPDELAHWIQGEDHFYVEDYAASPSIRSLSYLQELEHDIVYPCQACLAAHQAELDSYQHCKPLQGLELFAGILFFCFPIQYINHFVQVQGGSLQDFINQHLLTQNGL